MSWDVTLCRGRVIPISNILDYLTFGRWKHHNPAKCQEPLTKRQCHIPKHSKLQQCSCENLSVMNLYSDAVNTSDCI
jgi:hypothetical protein